MKSIKILVFFLLLFLMQVGFAETDKFDFVRDHPIRTEEFSKFGMVQITNDGSVFLDGKILLKGNIEKDDWGGTVDYQIADQQYDQTSSRVEVQAYGRKYMNWHVLRLVLVARSQNPVFYRILDLTGEKPFISEPFGKDGHWADELKNTKWGKNRTLIQMKYGMEYLYTKGKIIDGPFGK